MIGPLREWVRSLTGASVIAALARQLTPEGGVRKVTDFVCGVMLLSVLLSPVLEADLDALSTAAADYRTTAARLTADVEGQEKQLLRVYIQQQTGAYILDEARRLGAGELQAEVQAKWRDESWVPYEVTISGALSPEIKARLGEYLRSELGIPAERQRWNEP